MALTVRELQEGIKYWREETCWPTDFHNSFYERDLPTIQGNGSFDQRWWKRFHCLLEDWQATRGCRRTVLDSLAQERFPLLRGTYARVIAPHLGEDIEGVDWPAIAEFPLLVTEIKPLKSPSPVFTSKFCHFIAPSIFPVVDNEAMGKPFGKCYEAHFRNSRMEWLATDSQNRTALADMLAQEAGTPLFTGFPIKNKLVELCLIGRNRAKMNPQAI
jgi:hypothetical protein